MQVSLVEPSDCPRPGSGDPSTARPQRGCSQGSDMGAREMPDSRAVKPPSHPALTADGRGRSWHLGTGVSPHLDPGLFLSTPASHSGLPGNTASSNLRQAVRTGAT